MRTLSFEPDDRRFEQLYAVMIAGEPVRERSQGKLHGAVLDKMERIGQVKPAVNEAGDPRPHKADELRFYITVAGGEVVLEEAEYELLKARCVAAFTWVHVSLTRRLEGALDWLESLPKQDAATRPVSPVAPAIVDEGTMKPLGDESAMTGHA